MLTQYMPENHTMIWISSTEIDYGTIPLFVYNYYGILHVPE